VNTRDNMLSVTLTVCGDNAKAHFNLLLEDKVSVEEEVGVNLEWRENPKQNRIILTTEMDPKDKSKWPEQHTWLLEKLELFHRVFSPRVKSLDASDYQANE